MRPTLAARTPGVSFEVGDAERLRFDNDVFDAAICECALGTFPNKAAAAAEMARVVRPGARVAITDIWLDPSRLDAELTGLAGRIACLADACPIDELQGVLQRAWLTVGLVERHDQALGAMIERVETRLRALRLADLAALRRFDRRHAVDVARRARDMVARGNAGYALLVAVKP